MKKLLFLLLLSTKLVAQDGGMLGNHIKRNFVVTQYGHTRWGLEYLPDDFLTSGKKYPIMVFFHGTGETGSGEQGLSKLLLQGPSYFISQANDKMQFTNPNTGLVEKFIVLALQDAYWSPNINEVDYVLQNDPTLKNRTSAVFYTGLSAGAVQVTNAVTTSAVLSSHITAIIPMSSCGSGVAGGMQYAKGIPVWAFHGTSDNSCSYSFTSNFIDSLSRINAGTNISLRWTKSPVSHGPWNPLYDPSYRETVGDKQMNIYEWALAQIPGQTIGPTGSSIVFKITDATGKTYTIMSNGTWY